MRLVRFWIGLLCFTLSGCVSTGRSELADDEFMRRIKAGETTKQEVANLLGAPDSRLVLALGTGVKEWWSYTYARSTINPIDYLLVYGLFYNGVGTFDTRYDCAVFFDHRDVVMTLSTTRTDYDMGRPFSLGHITSRSQKIIGFPEPGKEPIHFTDRVEARF